MDETLIKKYKHEMMKMYNSRKKVIPAVANANPAPPTAEPVLQDGENIGGLIVAVTAVRSLYPVENALVTVFSGDMENRTTIAEDFTDQSGRTKRFLLETPNKSLSLDSENTQIPYSLYGIEVKAEGYADEVFLNLPVFSGVTSIQTVNMTLLETLGKDKGPFVTDESQQYTLGTEAE